MRVPEPLRRFAKAWRDFGFTVAASVAYSKLRGGFFPALALAKPPAYDGPRRRLTILLDAAGQDALGLQAAVDAVAERGGSDWEICLCALPPFEPQTARKLEQLRGTAPHIRVVCAEASTDAATAAQWTVEQSTGEFVALVAERYRLTAELLAALLSRLQESPASDAAILLGPPPESGGEAQACRIVLQRKSHYLAEAFGSWPLRAPALAAILQKRRPPAALLRMRLDPVGGRIVDDAL